MDWQQELEKPICFDPDTGKMASLVETMTWSAEKVARVNFFSKQARVDVPALTRVGLKDNQFNEISDDDIDYELDSPNKFYGSHVNLIPLQNAVAGPRLFYGARFYNQALPVVAPEAPWVQTQMDGDTRSFDDYFGEFAGARRAKQDGTVKKVGEDSIELDTPDGPQTVQLYNRFPFNRKSYITNKAMVKPGDVVKSGQILAKSNYTDDQGTLALGLNARIGVAPYKGMSMDDAMVISESFAKRLAADTLFGFDLDYRKGIKGGKTHYTGIFPQKFVKAQLEKLDDDGVVKPGTQVMPGDPIILATKPRVVSSSSAMLGQLSKHMRNAKSDASTVWDHESPGMVTDVVKLRNGVKLNIQAVSPTEIGDKIVMRSGHKGVVSYIVPDDKMPRTVDGNPLEMLLNPQGLPSRVNEALPYELLYGKIAKKLGKPFRLPAFNAPGEKLYDQVAKLLEENGLTDTEEVFDPEAGRKLANPIMVGDGYVLKLHHTSESKNSARSQGSYDNNQQPLHGGSEGGKAKRASGLETHAWLSAGAYGVIRENATVRGQKNDQYWRDLRMGLEPKEPGAPFVWEKFKALLTGSGYLARRLPGGKERLTFWTNKDLDKVRPIEVKSGDMVDLASLKPTPGGLFDDALTGANSWGYIQMPFAVPNPAAEDVVRKLLGMTEREYREVLAGRRELPEHLR